MKEIVSLNFLGILLVPLIALLEINPFIVILAIGILSVYYLFKIQRGFLTAISAWNLGFLFIIGSDGILNYYDISKAIGESQAQRAAIFFGYSLFIINIAYIWFLQRRLTPIQQGPSTSSFYTDQPTGGNLIAIIIMYIGFLFLKVPGAVETLISGRFYVIANSKMGGIEYSDERAWETLVNPLMNIVGYILPTLIYHYLLVRRKRRRRIATAILWSLPIFLTFLFTGTRYFILYSAGTFFVAYMYYNMKPIRRFSVVILFCLLAFFSASIISALRGGGISGLVQADTMNLHLDRTEATVKYMTMVVDHYDTNDFTLGSSTLANFVFWIPRSMWPEKPTMFGYWFIREYYGTSFAGGRTLSAPASFLAETYADFGVLGIFVLSLFLGYILLRIDLNLLNASNAFSIMKVIVFSLVPIVFFLPRQINVPLTSFVGILAVVYAFRYFAVSVKVTKMSM
ncbi:O-antigen polymerase [Gracilibacillus dipsosauri]|uniref:O-antigen polymerase n=1 Tax=Gracilibacillus dipsosauri TaxID=178340 RepID=UPI0024099691